MAGFHRRIISPAKPIISVTSANSIGIANNKSKIPRLMSPSETS